MTNMMNASAKLTLNELENIHAGYIVKDSNGYHVISDKRGDEIHCFQEDQYDFMMMMVHDKWKISDKFITWEKVEKLQQKDREKFFRNHPQ